jgi:hypothetical protein
MCSAHASADQHGFGTEALGLKQAGQDGRVLLRDCGLRRSGTIRSTVGTMRRDRVLRSNAQQQVSSPLPGARVRSVYDRYHASVITSNPAACDHFKSGQRSRTQDMKLLYRAGAGSGKLPLMRPARSRPAGGRRIFLVLPSKKGFCFGSRWGRRGEASAGCGASKRRTEGWQILW